MSTDKVMSNLEEILASILEIEDFRSVLSQQDSDKIGNMAVRAIERKIELIVKCWRNIKKHEPNISADEMLYFIKISNRLNSPYVGKSSPELILSTIDSKMPKLKNEIVDLMNDYGESN